MFIGKMIKKGNSDTYQLTTEVNGIQIQVKCPICGWYTFKYNDPDHFDWHKCARCHADIRVDHESGGGIKIGLVLESDFKREMYEVKMKDGEIF